MMKRISNASLLPVCFYGTGELLFPNYIRDCLLLLKSVLQPVLSLKSTPGFFSKRFLGDPPRLWQDPPVFNCSLQPSKTEAYNSQQFRNSVHHVTRGPEGCYTYNISCKALVDEERDCLETSFILSPPDQAEHAQLPLLTRLMVWIQMCVSSNALYN